MDLAFPYDPSLSTAELYDLAEHVQEMYRLTDMQIWVFRFRGMLRFEGLFVVAPDKLFVFTLSGDYEAARAWLTQIHWPDSLNTDPLVEPPDGFSSKRTGTAMDLAFPYDPSLSTAELYDLAEHIKQMFHLTDMHNIWNYRPRGMLRFEGSLLVTPDKRFVFTLSGDYQTARTWLTQIHWFEGLSAGPLVEASGGSSGLMDCPEEPGTGD